MQIGHRQRPGPVGEHRHRRQEHHGRQNLSEGGWQGRKAHARKASPPDPCKRIGDGGAEAGGFGKKG
jgi:hypothetical protein